MGRLLRRLAEGGSVQDLGGQVHLEVVEGGEGEVSPVLPSPGPRRAAACWQRRERSGRRRVFDLWHSTDH